MYKNRIYSIAILLILITVSSCSSIKKETKMLNTQFYDHKNNLIGSFKNREEFPKELSSYLTQVINQVEEKTGLDPFENVLDIYTNLNVSIQESLYEVYDLERENATVIKENKTGKVIGLVESVLDRTDESKPEIFQKKSIRSLWNYYFDSTFIYNPIYTYPLAFEYLNTSTSDYVLDAPYQIKDTPVVIAKPFSKEETYTNPEGLGVIPLKELFYKKRVGVMYLNEAVEDIIGYDKIKEYLMSIGKMDDEFYYEKHGTPALNSYVVSLESISNGYQMIMNLGEYHESQFVNRIVQTRKKTKSDLPLEFDASTPISSESAYLTTELLKYSMSHQAELSSIVKDNTYDQFGFSDSSVLSSLTDYEKEHFDGHSKGFVEMHATFVANSGFSIVDISRVLEEGLTESINKKTQEKINRLMNLLDSEFKFPDKLDKPAEVIETNYLPNSVNDKGIDLHLKNETQISNHGLSK